MWFKTSIKPILWSEWITCSDMFSRKYNVTALPPPRLTCELYTSLSLIYSFNFIFLNLHKITFPMIYDMTIFEEKIFFWKFLGQKWGRDRKRPGNSWKMHKIEKNEFYVVIRMETLPEKRRPHVFEICPVWPLPLH